jgi:hypothetical protein
LVAYQWQVVRQPDEGELPIPTWFLSDLDSVRTLQIEAPRFILNRDRLSSVAGFGRSLACVPSQELLIGSPS